MADIKEPSSSRDSISVDAMQQPGETPFLSKAQPLLLILFAGSTVALLVMWLAWRSGRHVPSIETPPPSQSFWLIVASATSLVSLLGLVSNTIFGWRKEQREARAEALNRRRQELEIQKLQLELERQKVPLVEAGQQALPQRDPVQLVQPAAGAPDPKTGTAEQFDAISAKIPPSPVAGERGRLQNRWSELDQEYQILTRHLAALDKDLGQALDSEQRLVKQERRNEMAAQRERIVVAMAGLERRLAELEQTA